MFRKTCGTAQGEPPTRPYDVNSGQRNGACGCRTPSHVTRAQPTSARCSRATPGGESPERSRHEEHDRPGPLGDPGGLRRRHTSAALGERAEITGAVTMAIAWAALAD